jgi:hypothetical protein
LSAVVFSKLASPVSDEESDCREFIYCLVPFSNAAKGITKPKEKENNIQDFQNIRVKSKKYFLAH